jgi:CofD-related protein of GAK system
VNKYLHLVAELEDGTKVLGQQALTGKEVTPIRSAVQRVYLSDDLSNPKEVQASIRNKTKKLIAEAELICFPVGSFFSSVIANLLPKGVGTAIKSSACPKVFIPNTNADPETHGLSVTDQVRHLLTYLRRDDPASIANKDVLNFILVDKKAGHYRGKLNKKETDRLGVEVINCALVTSESAPYASDDRLAQVLLSLT